MCVCVCVCAGEAADAARAIDLATVHVYGQVLYVFQVAKVVQDLAQFSSSLQQSLLPCDQHGCHLASSFALYRRQCDRRALLSILAMAETHDSLSLKIATSLAKTADLAGGEPDAPFLGDACR